MTNKQLGALAAFAASFLVYTTLLAAHTSSGVDEPQDRIEIVAHLPVAGGPVTRLIATQHYRRNYLYAEQDGGKGVTVIDVTASNAPSMVGQFTYPTNDNPNNLLEIAGTAAIVASPITTRSDVVPSTVRIMSFADPAHPKIFHEFTGITAIGGDGSRRLVFLANSDGIWILSKHFAEDPALMKAYAEHLRYDH